MEIYPEAEGPELFTHSGVLIVCIANCIFGDLVKKLKFSLPYV